MDKVRELETKLNEIVARFVNLEEIGFDDLNAAWKEIDEVKQEASTLVEDILVGATRQENGRFKSRSDIEFDIDSLVVLLVPSVLDSFLVYDVPFVFPFVNACDKFIELLFE